MKRYSLLTAFSFGVLLAAAAASPLAQERSASGATDMQASWTAIHTMAGSAMVKADNVNARVNSIVTCNQKAMMYVGAGGDADGCVDNLYITQLTTSVGTAEAQIKTINDLVDTLNKGLKDMPTALTTIEGTLSPMTNQVKSLQGTAADLSNKAADAATKLNSLNSQLPAVNVQLNDLKTKLDTHTGQIADLYAKIAAINTTIGSVNSTIASLNSTVSYVNGVISGLNTNMANVLNCGASNYIYNYNAGCVIPTTHTSCSIYLASSTNSVVACPGSQIMVRTVNGQNCSSSNHGSVTCTLFGTTKCYASTC